MAFGMGFGGEFFGGHGRRRFKRGMLRWVLLKVLDEGERHGYDFMRFLQTRGWSSGPGSIYPLLASLEAEGLVQGRDEGGRRVYTITDEGRRVLREDAPPWFQFTDIFENKEQPVNDQTQGAFDRLAAAWTQAKQVAKPETLDQIVEILNEARKDIYSALADE
jgi:DNA-binding PadR family transcriptional regulator